MSYFLDVLEMDVFQSHFALLYRVGMCIYIYIYILFHERESCLDKMQCDVRCMERYVILDVWDGLHVDYVVVSDVWKSSYVNKSICDTIYGRTHRFV
jgi:hypothetical protein